jgi:hypothetical protein
VSNRQPEQLSVKWCVSNMKSVSSNQSGTDYVSLLKFELNEMGLIYQDPSLKIYQKDVEQKLLDEEFDIRFSPDKDIQKKLLKLDKKGFERRYQARMLTSEEYRNGMELAREADRIFVPEADRKYGGLSGSLPEFLRNEDAILGLTGEFPTKYPTGINWKAVMETAMVVSAVVGGGIVLNKYSTDKKFANDVDSGIAKVKAQISGAASGMFGGIGGLINASEETKENKAPVARIKFNRDDLKGGKAIRFDASESYDPDGKIVKYKWMFEKQDGETEAEVTPTPVIEKKLESGLYKITLDAEDDRGKTGSADIGVNVEAPQKTSRMPEGHFLIYDGIKIYGDDEQAIKDGAMVLEFARKFSSVDYGSIKKNNKWVEVTKMGDRALGDSGGDGFRINKKYLRSQIEKKEILWAVGTAVHESEHNYLENTNPNILPSVDEDLARTAGLKARENLSYVPRDMIDEFYREFNFSDAVDNQDLKIQ